MAKKKKPTLKGTTSRGFATTSTPKRVDTEADQAATAPKDGESVGQTNAAGLAEENYADAAASTTDTGLEGELSSTNDYRFDPEAARIQELQNIVDAIGEKYIKETTRLSKSLEFDRRLSSSLPTLEVDPQVCEEIVGFALTSSQIPSISATPSTTPSGAATPAMLDVIRGSEEQQEMLDAAASTTSRASAASIPLSTAGITMFSEPEEKVLLRVLVTLNMLRRVGFAIEQAEASIVGAQSLDLEECLAWLFLNIPGEELERRFVKNEGAFGSAALEEEAAERRPPFHEGFSFSRNEASKMARLTALLPAVNGGKSYTASAEDLQAAVEMLNSLTEDVTSVMNEQDTLEHPNASAVALQLAKLRLARAATPFKAVLQSAEGSAISSRLNKLEQELNDKIAEAERAMGYDAKACKVDFKQAQLAYYDDERTKRKTSAKADSPSRREGSGTGPVSSEESSTANCETLESEDAEETLFGHMLDEMPTEISDASTGAVVKLRPMPPQPKGGGSGRTPRALLQNAFARSGSSYNSATYEVVGGGGRVCRSRLILRWEGPSELGGKTTWVDTCQLTTIGCETQAQADDLIATVALNYIVRDQPVYRTLPPPYRIWWDELETLRKDEQDGRLRDAVQSARALVQPMVDEAVAKKASRTGKAANKDDSAGRKEAWNDLPDLVSDSSNRIDVDHVRAQRQAAYRERVASSSYQQILPQRQTLPISSYRSQILDLVHTSSIFVLSGETGCGKSTQLPAMILEDALGRGEQCKIYVTEPRRISAISLAERVSQELGEARGSVGSDSSLVGSAVRLESNVGRNAQLVYATTGIVLRMLEGSSFNDITHLICDEIHERDIQSDFLLIILKTLLKSRSDLKVILMSATVDADRLSAYCNDCPTIAVPGRTFPVDARYLEDAVELCKYKLEERSPYARRQSRQHKAHVTNRAGLISKNEERPPDLDDEDNEYAQSPSLDVSITRYSPRTIATLDMMDEYAINQDLIVKILEAVCFESPELQRYSAATLIFLPGLAEIRKCSEILTAHPIFGSTDFVVYPLHSSIASDQQGAVFDVPPKGVRKIVIATNIAETGITIPDCTCVIDSGKQREMRFDERRQISKLVECFVAKSNAKQRRGRAGRVQDGLCFHLFTKARHDLHFPDYPEPEMKRLSLQDLALQLKLFKIQVGTSIEDALSQALDPPKPANIQRAVAALVEVKALTTAEEITPLGRHLARLPLDVHMGKFLIVSTLLKCLDPALTIAATLNSKSPFVTPFGRETEADAAKSSFKIGNSDFLTIANAFNAWRRSVGHNHHRQFCAKAFLSHQTLTQIEELRQQYMRYLLDSGFVQVDASVRRDISRARYRSSSHKPRFMDLPSDLSQHASSAAILHAGLASGLYPKVISIDPRSHQLTTMGNNQPVSIHPSSVNFRMRMTELPKTMHHLLYFTIMQSRKLYAWEVGAVDDRALVLFCGDAEFKLSSSSLYVDRNKLRWRIPDPKAALALRLLREHLTKLMTASFRNPGKPWTPQQIRYFDFSMRYLGFGANDQDMVLQL